MSSDQTIDDPDAEQAGSCEWLLPRRSYKLRLGIWIALCALGLIGTAAAGPTFAFCLSMGLLTGSFPQAYLLEGALCKELYVLFFRVNKKRWKLSRFIQIEIGLEDRPFDNMANVLKLGELLNQIWAWFDACVPWLGGDYKIYLRSSSGKRVLAWHGSNDAQYQANLELLRTATGLKIDRR
jgi:hypothetical protein